MGIAVTVDKELENKIKEEYPKIDHLAITPNDARSTNVGMKVGEVSMAQTVFNGPNFIEDLAPMYYQLIKMNKEIRDGEAANNK